MRSRLVRRGRLAAAFFVCVLTALVHAGVPAGADGPLVNGGGSTFAALAFQRWGPETARKPYSINVNYSSQGSAFGRNTFISNTLDFGASDIPFTSGELSQLSQKPRCQGGDTNSCFTYVPVTSGGLALMYNLHDSAHRQITDLKLSRKNYCRIVTGDIVQWNDPALVADGNSKLASLNNQPINLAARELGAGENYVLSEYCKTVAPDVWGKFVDYAKGHDGNATDEFKSGGPSSYWPSVGSAGSGFTFPPGGADGVANFVSDPVTGVGGAGYVAAAYAQVRHFPVASIQNGAGVYTQPLESNVTVALGYARANHVSPASPQGDGTFTLAFDGPDQRAYFPSTYSYVIAQTKGWDPAKGSVLGRYLCYAVSKGQENFQPNSYARLSSVLVTLAINQIAKIAGAPAPANCPVAGSAPPPPPPQVAGGAGGAGSGAGAGSAGAAGSGSALGAAGPSGAAAAGQSAAGDASGSGDAAGSGSGTGGSFSATNASSGHGFSNGNVLWTMAQGALLVVVGVGIAAWKRHQT
jgi:ABC-type phosphate transport system substrate-binding protein